MEIKSDLIYLSFYTGQSCFCWFLHWPRRAVNSENTSGPDLGLEIPSRAERYQLYRSTRNTGIAAKMIESINRNLLISLLSSLLFPFVCDFISCGPVFTLADDELLKFSPRNARCVFLLLYGDSYNFFSHLFTINKNLFVFICKNDAYK